MKNSKYQVFISSTYIDLIDERKKVLDVLLLADCIPAGMESFVATDDEQFNVIKKVIDLCDYYILILGKRYGSINPSTSLSYTEMEYNYAKEKEIPVLVFVIDDSVQLDSDKIETDAIKNGKLAEFKNRAMTNRLANIWKDSSDLIGKVAISIMQAKNVIPRPGWHRGNIIDNDAIMRELLDLRKENASLKADLESLSQLTNNDDFENLFNKEVELHYTEQVYVFTSNTIVHEKTINVTLSELFKFISLRLTGIKTAKEFLNAINSYVSGYYVDTQHALIVRNKYEQLQLIESFLNKDNTEMIKLTDRGLQIMNQLNS